MPQLIGVIIAAVIALIPTIPAWVGSIIGAVLSIGISFAANALFGNKKTPQSHDLQTTASGQSTLVRSPVSPKRIIYGERLVSGVLAFAATRDSSSPSLAITSSGNGDNRIMSLVVVHAGHECHAVTDLYFGDERMPPRFFDANGDAVSGNPWWKDGSVYMTVKSFLGKDSQAADGQLVNDYPALWGGAHRLRGLCYTKWRLKYSDLFPNGLQNLRALVKGKKVWDPRKAAIATIVNSVYVTAGSIQIKCAAAHGLAAGDKIFIQGHDNPQIWGEYEVIAVDSATVFSIEQELETVTGIGSGGNVYTMQYSINPVLCTLDFIVHKELGLGALEEELNLTQISAAANTCEEMVELNPEASAFEPISETTNVLRRNTNIIPINTGSRVRLTSNTSLPAGLSENTDYYYISRGIPDEFQLATSFANAVLGTAVTVGASVSGQHTLTRYSQPRYTCNGIVESNERPLNTLEKMATSFGGSVVYIQGQYNIFVAAAGSSVGTLTVDDLRGDLELVADPSLQEIFNRVNGTFVNPGNFWEVGDVPPVKNRLYELQDRHVIIRNVELPFTADIVEAQRILTMFLNKSRQGATLRMPCNLRALKFQPWDVVSVTIPDFGYAAKAFRVLEWKLTAEGNGMGVDLLLQEEGGAAVYDWNAGQELLYDPAPDTALPDIRTVAAPTNLTLNSGTGELYVAGDGTVVSRIRATWTAAKDAFVSRYEIQTRNRTTGEPYETYGYIDKDQTSLYIEPVEDGEQYDARVRSVNIRGALSDWLEVTAHKVIGKTAPPENVSGFAAQQNGSVVTFRWNQVSDPDVSGYEIRFSARGTTFSWSSSAVVTSVTKGTLVTNTAIPPGDWTAAIKAVDTSGNYSVDPATADVYVTSDNTIAYQRNEWPRWLGLPGVNLLTRSEEFDHADWTKTNVTVAADQIASPRPVDGAVSADRVSETAANGQHYVEESFTAEQGEYYVLSAFFKYTNRPHVWLGLVNPANGQENSRYTDIQVPATGGGANVNDQIDFTSVEWGVETHYDLGWVRFFIVVKANYSGACRARIGLNDTSSQSYVGDASKNVYCWGAQVERGRGLTGYVSTFAAASNPTTRRLIRHEVSGTLMPDTTVLAKNSGANTFNSFAANPYSDLGLTARYDAPEIDIGSDQTLRFYAETDASLGPGETTGAANPQLQVDYRVESGAYDGYEIWTGAALVPARRIKPRLVIDSALGKYALNSFIPTIDLMERQDEHGESVLVTPGGRTITFATPFLHHVNIQVTATGPGAFVGIPENQSLTGFKAKHYSSVTGAEATGSINWTAKGA